MLGRLLLHALLSFGVSDVSWSSTSESSTHSVQTYPPTAKQIRRRRNLSIRKSKRRHSTGFTPPPNSPAHMLHSVRSLVLDDSESEDSYSTPEQPHQAMEVGNNHVGVLSLDQWDYHGVPNSLHETDERMESFMVDLFDEWEEEEEADDELSYQDDPVTLSRLHIERKIRDMRERIYRQQQLPYSYR